MLLSAAWLNKFIFISFISIVLNTIIYRRRKVLDQDLKSLSEGGHLEEHDGEEVLPMELVELEAK